MTLIRYGAVIVIAVLGATLAGCSKSPDSDQQPVSAISDRDARRFTNAADVRVEVGDDGRYVATLREGGNPVRHGIAERGDGDEILFALAVGDNGRLHGRVDGLPKALYWPVGEPTGGVSANSNDVVRIEGTYENGHRVGEWHWIFPDLESPPPHFTTHLTVVYSDEGKAIRTFLTRNTGLIVGLRSVLSEREVEASTKYGNILLRPEVDGLKPLLDRDLVGINDRITQNTWELTTAVPTAFTYIILAAIPANIRSMLDLGADFNVVDSEGRTALQRCAATLGSCGDQTLLWLIERSDNINHVGPGNQTVLHRLIEYRRAGVYDNITGLRELLARGADPNVYSQAGRDQYVTALYHAVSLGNMAAVDILLKHSTTDVNLGHWNGTSAIVGIVEQSMQYPRRWTPALEEREGRIQQQKLERIAQFLDRGGNLNVSGPTGEPLWWHVRAHFRRDAIALFRALFEGGTDPGAKSRSGLTFEEYCLANNMSWALAAIE